LNCDSSFPPCLQNDSLTAYAKAAADMGSKQWVQHGNKYMLDFIHSYFTTSKAKLFYARRVNQQYLNQHGQWMSQEAFRGCTDALADNLMLTDDVVARECNNSSSSSRTEQASKKPRKIRILDVGSCYNPFIRSEHKDAIDVVALDLCPADDTVFKCDFLNVRVGSGLEVDDHDRDLKCLPAEAFDAVCMSWVLYNLPTDALHTIAMFRLSLL
jgi:hypothetical protein